MSLRRLSVVFTATLAVVFTACPPVISLPDANEMPFDGGNPPPREGCSGGCAANQVCNVETRTCVDACGGCDAGICVQTSPGVYQCRENSVTCNGVVCEPGQVACIGGECSCLSSLSGALDTCQTAGKWCSGKTCANPRALQECDPQNTSARCPTGFTCHGVFGDINLCTKDCADTNGCDRGDICIAPPIFQGNVGCLPMPIALNDSQCEQNVSDGDGGFLATRRTVTVGNTCLLKAFDTDALTVVVTEAPGVGTGNCGYTVLQFWDDGVYPLSTCRPPGAVAEGGGCRTDMSPTSVATQCSTGLQCVATKGGDEGVCLRMCNAQPPAFGFPPQPECLADEACVNTLRYTDPNSNAVLGACMKKCDVFGTDGGTCGNVGTTATSCVPTQPSGELAVSLDGTGICIPQRAQVAAPGATCTETDSFRGAACGSAQICTSLNADVAASCTPVCDVTCNPTDGGTGPAACDTRPNARCTDGKTCRRVTSTSGARVGFCL